MRPLFGHAAAQRHDSCYRLDIVRILLIAMETLSKHFRQIARAVFERHGFAQADVVANWGEIVGEELARHSAPERIKWPRGAGEAARKSGGTLAVRAAPGRALDLQYEAPRIIARVNSFFGYEAVVKIKVMQAPTQWAGRPPPSPPPPRKSVPLQSLEGIEAQPLKAALERLGQGVASRRPSSPQLK